MHNHKPPLKIIDFFIAKDEARLRAGWRLLLHALITIFLGMITGFIAAIGLIILGSDFTVPIGGIPKHVDILFTLPPIILGTFIARSVLDQRSISSLGLSIDRRLLPDLMVGFGIAALMMGLIFLVEWTVGWLEVESIVWTTTRSSDWILGLLGGLGYFIVIGFQEELIFRGYQLQNLVDSLDLPKGLVLSSLLFTIAHVLNPHASLLSTLGIFLAGIFFVYGWLRTHQLWLPIGLHIGWNFFEGNVFGFPVSGTETFHLINHTVSGPSLLTGGDFGPEAGLILIPALAFGILLIWLYTRTRINVKEEPSLTEALFGQHI